MILRIQLQRNINNMMQSNNYYFGRFNRIVLYYDNGQTILGKILVSCFNKYKGFEHKYSFDKKKKKLFQVADMLTSIDKYDYKYNHNVPFSVNEKRFFNDTKMKNILQELRKKRL